MEAKETLKKGRDLLLKLHKALLDRERQAYENMHGPLNATQFLNVLLEDEDFGWLRKFSMLIVEIDEMFDLDDGIPNEMIEANLAKLKELVDMKIDDEYFKAKYSSSLQNDLDAAALQAELRAVLA